MSALPKEPVARKAVPIFSGVVKYFPDALAAVAELSKIGNEQHNPGKPLQWDRSKSGDELDALTRHLVDAGTMDIDGVRHSTKVAWRALANLQKELELNPADEAPVTAQIAAVAWQPWDGGGRYQRPPITSHALVYVRLRNGEESTEPREIRNYWWNQTDSPLDILAWRYAA